MNQRGESFLSRIRGHFKHRPTSCQEELFRKLALFVSENESDILIVNGYAGTGKTTALSAFVDACRAFGIKVKLLAPTGRSAKVLSGVSKRKAQTIHKGIYQQKSFGADGMGRFVLSKNPSKGTIYIVDEVSLIGITHNDSTISFGSGDLLSDLLEFVRQGEGNLLVLCGDDAQLPPVGLDMSPALDVEYMSMYGEPLTACLSEVVRQEKESGILHNATILREMISASREAPLSTLKLDTGGFDDICRINGGELLDALSDAYSSFGEDETVVLCRSNKRANRYNGGIRSMVLYHEEELVRGDKIMVVRNNYKVVEDNKEMEYVANGEVARVERLGKSYSRFGFNFRDALLSFPDCDDMEIEALVCTDTLSSESSSLTFEQQSVLYDGLYQDYSQVYAKKKEIVDAVREDRFFNALQIKYAYAITCHKSQGGQWDCVFIDCPFWQDEISTDDLKWLYTALTRAVKKVYLVNFPDRFF